MLLLLVSYTVYFPVFSLERMTVGLPDYDFPVNSIEDFEKMDQDLIHDKDAKAALVSKVRSSFWCTS